MSRPKCLACKVIRTNGAPFCPECTDKKQGKARPDATQPTVTSASPATCGWCFSRHIDTHGDCLSCGADTLTGKSKPAPVVPPMARCPVCNVTTAQVASTGQCPSCGHGNTYPQTQYIPTQTWFSSGVAPKKPAYTTYVESGINNDKIALSGSDDRHDMVYITALTGTGDYKGWESPLTLDDAMKLADALYTYVLRRRLVD